MLNDRFSLNGDGTPSQPPPKNSKRKLTLRELREQREQQGAGSQPSPDDAESRVAAELSEQYRQLAALWGNAEERLLKFRIPIDVRVPCGTWDDLLDQQGNSTPKVRSFLGFVKYGRGWRICWCQNHDHHPEHDWDWKPVVDCPVDVRREMFPHIDKLREAVVNAAKNSIPKLEKDIATFRKMLENW